ncbi:MAG: hypothetical protein AAFR79_12075, partial [Pseudomonadota bacterium]
PAPAPGQPVEHRLRGPGHLSAIAGNRLSANGQRLLQPDGRCVGSEAKLTLANIVYNFDRLMFHERPRAKG